MSSIAARTATTRPISACARRTAPIAATISSSMSRCAATRTPATIIRGPMTTPSAIRMTWPHCSNTSRRFDLIRERIHARDPTNRYHPSAIHRGVRVVWRAGGLCPALPGNDAERDARPRPDQSHDLGDQRHADPGLRLLPVPADLGTHREHRAPVLDLRV